MTHRSPWAFVTLRAALVGILLVVTMILGVAAACTAPPQTEAPSPVVRTEPSPTLTTQPAPTDTAVPSDTPAPPPSSTPTSTPLPTHTPTPTPEPTATPSPTPTGMPIPSLAPAPTNTPSLAEIAAQPNTVTVCADGCDFTIIQAAVDDPDTLAGSVIYVTDAVHTEAGVVVNKDVTLRGRSADQTTVQAHERAGQARDRVFFIPEGVSVTIEEMTIRHGYPRADIRSGGAIENRGTLTVSRCVIRDNQANCGGGVYNEGGMLTVLRSTIRDNKADGEAPIGYECGAGGAIKVTEGGTLTLTDSTLADNRAKLRGGGLHVSCKSTAALVNSTISGNSAGGRGGGINLGGTVHLTHCTITGNSAKGVLRRSQIDRNPAGGVSVRGTLHYTNTLIANNPKGGDCVVGGSGVVGANAYNLVEDGGCGAAFSGDPGIDDLADNGGDTETRALPPGSPALDAVPADACPLSTDQRGYTRPVALTSPDTPCDIGAFELGGEASAQGMVGGWAVLAEKDDYSDVGMTDMLVDYMGVVRMR